jgi:small subunit ribosomal protein S16
LHGIISFPRLSARMLVIRLQRTGRTNLATYRIVVAEKARAVKGKFLEIIGHYLPAQKNAVFSVDTERVEYWVSKGAVPSDTVARLLKKQGVKNMDKFIVRYAKRRSNKAPVEEPVAAAAPAAPAPAEAAAEPAAEAAQA